MSGVETLFFSSLFYKLDLLPIMIDLVFIV